jgi:HlyD family secretion protein
MKSAMNRAKKWAGWLVVVVIVGAGGARALAPKPAIVNVAEVTRGPLRVTLREEGRTRVKARYTVVAPVNGALERITLDPGSAVDVGAPLAKIAPRDAAPLDARSRGEALARRVAAEAAQRRAQIAITQATTAHDFARAELDRTQRLADGGNLPPRDLEVARNEERVRAGEIESARLGAEMARAEVELANATLQRPGADRGHEIITVTAPIRGRIFRVIQREGLVAAGASLLELADPAALEIVVEMLTADAAALPPAATVALRGWGGASTLHGRVRRVEPSAFTKISALGVEEQRVPVVIDLDDPAQPGATLGDGFRVEAEIDLWDAESAIRMPVSALFRDGASWAVFVVANGKAARRRVEIGHRNGEEAEVISGLAAGERVIAYPSDTLAEGAAVVAR